jgi:hypothetical protein
MPGDVSAGGYHMLRFISAFIPIGDHSFALALQHNAGASCNLSISTLRGIIIAGARVWH